MGRSRFYIKFAFNIASELIYFAGIGCGIIPMLSSYRQRHEDIWRVSVLIPFLNFFAGFFSVTLIFMILGFLQKIEITDGF
jgi:hypothetical protein